MVSARWHWIVLSVCFSVTPVGAEEAHQPSALPRQFHFEIPAQPLDQALNAFARQAQLRVAFYAVLGHGLVSPHLSGDYTPDDALRSLLARTGLRYKYLDADSVAILGNDIGDKSNSMSRISSSPTENGVGDDSDSLQEVLVTGSHIRGALSASPIITVTRDDIDRSGYTVVGDVMRSIPQNYGGGNNPQVQIGNAPTPGNANYSGGSSPNLRGLGPGSTLTLVNGHRLSQDGPGGAVDISLIPLAAVDHIDIVTDSGSAIYGSDAVAGVVNFVLKKDYSGAETDVSYADSTDGGGSQVRASQLVGGAWQSGNAMLVYEHTRQDPVQSYQRDFTSTAPTPNWLLPESSRNSVYAALTQAVSDALSGTADALYTSRDASLLSSFPKAFGVPPIGGGFSVDQFAGNVGVNASLPGKWNAGATLSAAEERNSSTTYFTTPNIQLGAGVSISKVQSIELVSDGPLLDRGARPIRLAVGAGYRREAYVIDTTYPAASRQGANRDVEYIFSELNAPLLESSETDSRRLNLTLSGRYEKYSDVGKKFVPKIGVLFAPVERIQLHSSWSQSFRAPTLSALDGSSYVSLEPVSDPRSPTGASLTLLRSGSNPTLRPETASSWTAGIDIHPAKEVQLSANYFNIAYKNRIVAFAVPTILSDPAYASLVTRSPSLAFQQSVIDAPGTQFFNYSGAPYNPSTVAAVGDGRYLNLASQHVDGIDLLADYKHAVSRAQMDLFANATYLQIRQQVTSNAQSFQIVGTAFNPPRFRARSGGTLIAGPWSVTAVLNWTGSFVNTYQPSSPSVASWSTVDMQLTYTPPWRGVLGGVRASLAVQNLLDKDPPFLSFNRQTIGFNYDSTNASPLGRFITLQISKSWGLMAKSQ